LTGVELDVEALLQLQLAWNVGELLGGCRDRRRRDGRELHRGFGVGPSDERRAGRQRLWIKRCGR
jgi:hypothetical protein